MDATRELILGNSMHAGYCGSTCSQDFYRGYHNSYGYHKSWSQAHICQAADKGSFSLSVQESSNWEHAVTSCLSYCVKCERCRFISVSALHRDCSWFQTCDLLHLNSAVPGFRSALVDINHNRIVSGDADKGASLQQGQRIVGPARKHREDTPSKRAVSSVVPPTCFIALGVQSA